MEIPEELTITLIGPFGKVYLPETRCYGLISKAYKKTLEIIEEDEIEFNQKQFMPESGKGIWESNRKTFLLLLQNLL